MNSTMWSPRSGPDVLEAHVLVGEGGRGEGSEEFNGYQWRLEGPDLTFPVLGRREGPDLTSPVPGRREGLTPPGSPRWTHSAGGSWG